MKRTSLRHLAALLLTLTGLWAGGCNKSANRGGDQTSPPPPTVTVDDHSHWWCSAHGVPEDVCALCNTKLAAEYQRKGDWCEEHLRPQSQCFVCSPQLAEQFAAEYEAKYGKRPPTPTGS